MRAQLTVPPLDLSTHLGAFVLPRVGRRFTLHSVDTQNWCSFDSFSSGSPEPAQEVPISDTRIGTRVGEIGPRNSNHGPSDGWAPIRSDGVDLDQNGRSNSSSVIAFFSFFVDPSIARNNLRSSARECVNCASNRTYCSFSFLRCGNILLHCCFQYQQCVKVLPGF